MGVGTGVEVGIDSKFGRRVETANERSGESMRGVARSGVVLVEGGAGAGVSMTGGGRCSYVRLCSTVVGS